MKRQLVRFSAAAALLLGATVPASAAYANFANWNWCSTNSLSVCMGFNLQRDGATNDYRLTASYLNTSVGKDGIMTAVGLYRLPNQPDVNISNLAVVTPGSWTVGASQLTGGGASVFEVASNSANGVVDGVAMGGSVVITFSSTSGDGLKALYARSHIQSLGAKNCSIKPDSRVGVVGGVAAADASCGTTSTVPEPISLVLLGSGLLGIGGVRLRRRRQS